MTPLSVNFLYQNLMLNFIIQELSLTEFYKNHTYLLAPISKYHMFKLALITYS